MKYISTKLMALARIMLFLIMIFTNGVIAPPTDSQLEVDFDAACSIDKCEVKLHLDYES